MRKRIFNRIKAAEKEESPVSGQLERSMLASAYKKAGGGYKVDVKSVILKLVLVKSQRKW